MSKCISNEELEKLNALLEEKSVVSSRVGSLSASHLLETQRLLDVTKKEYEYEGLLREKYGDVNIDLKTGKIKKPKKS